MRLARLGWQPGKSTTSVLLFLTAGESSNESVVHAVHSMALLGNRRRQDRTLPALGKDIMQNAVPLSSAAYQGQTIVFIDVTTIE